MKPFFPAYKQFSSVADSHDPYLIIDDPVKGTSVKIKLSDFSPKIITALITSLGGDANSILRTDANGDLVLSDYPLAFGTAAGTDTYTVTLAPAIDAITTGVPFLVKFTNANTGASTLNPNGLGAKSLVKRGNVALSRADIVAGKYYMGVYDGTNIQLDLEDDDEPYGAATGTDTYAVTMTPTIFTLETGNPFYVKFANTNTGAATLDVDGLGAKDLRKSASTALAANDIVVDKIYRCIYDGTNIQIDIPVSEWTETVINIPSGVAATSGILGLGTVPVIVLAAPGAGKYYEWVARLEYTFVSNPYTCIDTLMLGGDFSYSGSFINSSLIATGNKVVMCQSQNSQETENGIGSPEVLRINPMNINENIVLTTWNAVDPTLGDGTLRIVMKYKVHTFGA